MSFYGLMQLGVPQLKGLLHLLLNLFCIGVLHVSYTHLTLPKIILV